MRHSPSFLARSAGPAVVTAIVGLTVALATNRADAAPGDTHTQAAQKGLDFLTPDVVAFTVDNQCIACHRQGAALHGISLAKSAGFDIDGDASAFLADQIAQAQQEGGNWTHFGDFNNSKSSYAFYGLAGYDAYVKTAYSANLVEAADWSVLMQQWDGHWDEDHGGFPTTYGVVPITSRFMVGIAQAKKRVDVSKAASYQAALDQASGYITSQVTSDDVWWGVPYTFEAAWGLIGLKAAGVADDDPSVQAYVSLIEARTSDLGYAWGYAGSNGAPDPFGYGASPDPFNTGMAIYALSKAGVPAIGNTSLQQALEWLNDSQQPGGEFGTDVATTFAILGLAAYGDYGVTVNNSGVTSKVIDAHSPNPQVATYDFDIANRGFQPDTYMMSLAGGMPGWSGSISPSSLLIPAGGHALVTLTVNAPPMLPEALPVEMTVIATSKVMPVLNSSARITTFTNPPPPVTGDPTAVSLTSGDGASVEVGHQLMLAATVKDAANDAPVQGPAKGVVTFFVAGVAIATDTDDDGDGVFEVPFTPAPGWTAFDAQDFRAIYSGIDLPAGQVDLLSSLASGTIDISAPKCVPSSEVCDGIDNDCDGVADNGNPGGGLPCDTGLPGVCAAGITQCSQGAIVCDEVIQVGQLLESCNGLDDDCNGEVDDGFDVGSQCSAGRGVCAADGVIACREDGSAACNAVPGSPQKEICGDELDSDCDGSNDNGCECLKDADCSSPGEVCDAAGTFECVAGCRGDKGCPTGLLCTSAGSAVGVCVACIADSDCGGADSGKVCSEHSKCEEGCRGSDGNGCPANLTCSSDSDRIGTCQENASGTGGAGAGGSGGSSSTGIKVYPVNHFHVSALHASVGTPLP